MSKGLSISAKMLGAFTALMIISASVSIFAITKLQEVNSLSTEVRSRWLPATQIIGDIHAYASQYRIQQSAHVSAESPAAKARAEKMMHNGYKVVSELIANYQPLLASQEQKDLYADLEKKWAEYGQLTSQMTALSNANDVGAMDMFTGQTLDMFYAIEDDILQLNDLNQKGGQIISSKTGEIYTQSSRMLIAAAVIGLTITLALASWLMFAVAKPIKLMSESVKRLVEGDMSVEVPGAERKDELGSLARALDSFKTLFAADKERAQAELERARETETTIKAIGGGLAALAKGDLTYRVDNNATGPLGQLHHDFNEAVEHLLETLKEIVNGCHVIRDGTSEIAQASLDLSQRTEKQAESVGHATRTVGEFSEAIRVAADSARETSTRLTVARTSAEKVDETAKRAVVAMRNIESSSKEMTDIISTIDGLAFQTNLLALNAGVEAARAGTAGAGFAVVANEVRQLAQRSAEAASSIRHLVATSSAQINEGVTLVENSGDALRQIVTEVTEISDLMDEIAEAAGRQAGGISEISSMITSMDNTTQQNAAMVEESSASSRNLSNETRRLFEQLSFFELGSGSSRTSTSTAALSMPATNFAKAPVVSSSMPLPKPASAPVAYGNLAVAVDEDDWSEF